jgi:polyvinyl alcohol dehydrogenase (cytochrome)
MAALAAVVLSLPACTRSVEAVDAGGGSGASSAASQPDGAEGSGSFDWPAFLFDLRHSSANEADTGIAPEDASSLRRLWDWRPDAPTQPGQPPAQLFATPVVHQGRIYIGANTGEFYALQGTTGTVLWTYDMGFQEADRSCGARGITSTATVAIDPATSRATVYVGGADGALYALDADTGELVWKERIFSPEEDGHNWSSPTVAQGRVYMGVSAHCKSVVRGGVKQFDQATGRLLGAYWTVPEGTVGGSVWSTVAASGDGSIFVSVGADPDGSDSGDSYAIVRVDSETMTKVDSWQAPLLGTDLDFGSSPTLFTATVDGTKTPLVGACNKNGHYYALAQNDLAAGPVWDVQVSGQWPDEGNCLGAAVWDARSGRLFIAAAQTTVAGEEYRGSVRALDPATGEAVWETGLPGSVWGSPTLNGAGLLAVPSFDQEPEATRGIFLVDSRDGSLVTTLDTDDSPVFAQPVLSGDYLYAAGHSGLIAYAKT